MWVFGQFCQCSKWCEFLCVLHCTSNCVAQFLFFLANLSTSTSRDLIMTKKFCFFLSKIDFHYQATHTHTCTHTNVHYHTKTFENKFLIQHFFFWVVIDTCMNIHSTQQISCSLTHIWKFYSQINNSCNLIIFWFL